MQSEKVNYQITRTAFRPLVSETKLSPDVCQWLPGFGMHPQALHTPREFALNTSSFIPSYTVKQFERPQLSAQGFVGIQEVISIILAQEKTQGFAQ